MDNIISAIIGAVISAIITALFSLMIFFIKERRTKKAKQIEENKLTIQNKPELKIVNAKKYLPNIKNLNIKCNHNILIASINHVSAEGFVEYDESDFDFDKLSVAVYELQNAGKTDISFFDTISVSPKSYCVFDAQKAKWFFDSKFLNYNALYDRKIRVGESFTLKIFYNSRNIGNSINFANLYLGMVDSNGHYWLQPLFIANDNVYDSHDVSKEDYHHMFDVNIALECFKNPYLW